MSREVRFEFLHAGLGLLGASDGIVSFHHDILLIGVSRVQPLLDIREFRFEGADALAEFLLQWMDLLARMPILGIVAVGSGVRGGRVLHGSWFAPAALRARHRLASLFSVLASSHSLSASSLSTLAASFRFASIYVSSVSMTCQRWPGPVNW